MGQITHFALNVGTNRWTITIIKELVDLDIGEAVDEYLLTPKQRELIFKSFMFIKEKLKNRENPHVETTYSRNYCISSTITNLI